MGDGSSPGNPTLAKYFPNAVFTYNVLAGGTASLYPATNSFPTVAQWNASFVDPASGDYRLLASSTSTAPAAAAQFQASIWRCSTLLARSRGPRPRFESSGPSVECAADRLPHGRHECS